MAWRRRCRKEVSTLKTNSGGPGHPALCPRPPGLLRGQEATQQNGWSRAQPGPVSLHRTLGAAGHSPQGHSLPTAPPRRPREPPALLSVKLVGGAASSVCLLGLGPSSSVPNRSPPKPQMAPPPGSTGAPGGDVPVSHPCPISAQPEMVGGVMWLCPHPLGTQRTTRCPP